MSVVPKTSFLGGGGGGSFDCNLFAKIFARKMMFGNGALGEGILGEGSLF